MRRNIIRQGNKSFTLTLPIDWVREHRLKGGEELNIEQEENKLVISLPKFSKSLDVSIDLDLRDYKKISILMIIHQCYRKGFDKISIRYKDKEQLDYIKWIAKNTLLGFEVVNETGEICVLQNIAEPSPEKFDVILRKLFLLIKDEANEIYLSLKAKNIKDFEKREDARNACDNFTNYIRRVIAKNRLGSRNSYLLYYFIANLSWIQHSFYYFYKVCFKEKIKNVSNDVLDLLYKTIELYDFMYKCFYKKDLFAVNEVRKKSDDLLDYVEDKITKNKGISNRLLLVLSIIIRTYATTTTVMFGLDLNDPEHIID